MSASGVRELLSTTAGVVRVAREYLSLDLTESLALRYVASWESDDDSDGWCVADNAVSLGPLVYLKSRLREDGIFAACPPEEPDDVPIMFKKVGRKCYAVFDDVARSKMFRTPLVVYPIDLTAARVSVKSYSER